jgi:hypothetical protein
VAWKDNPNRPKYVTKRLAHAWQPYVDSQIRRQITKGVEQEAAVERALDLRDEHIKNGDKPPKRGKK